MESSIFTTNMNKSIIWMKIYISTYIEILLYTILWNKNEHKKLILHMNRMKKVDSGYFEFCDVSWCNTKKAGECPG